MTKTLQRGFTGSYDKSDCLFLLTEISTNRIAEQEAAVATGATQIGHYRQLLPQEAAPEPCFFDIYDLALDVYKERVAREVMRLAMAILRRSQGGPIVLASLARAGTPYGALLVRALRVLGREDAVHYSISLIHKHGVDKNALDYILAQHPGCAFWFIDGWTGKGGISRELHRSVTEYNSERGTNLPTKLAVIADLAGMACLASTTDDYMIPSAPIDAPLNGLVSRTIVSHADIGPTDFHGGMIYEHLADCDRSNDFIGEISVLFPKASRAEDGVNGLVTPHMQEQASRRSWDTLTRLKTELGIEDDDLIKHGMCESIRAVKRRPMRRFYLRELFHPRNFALRAMAKAKGIELVSAPDSAYDCIAICQS
ncbi:MAG: hypothetical protein K2W82_10830 [Candidatus Obscuribacterales bacterium]|nr:hypothetical protein [Candidatus Obscuribacterales bacterium]